MSTVRDAVDQVRSDARDLHKKIGLSTAKNHSVIRGDLQDGAVQAKRLATSLKALAKDQAVDAKAHLEHAASLLEAAAAGAQTVGKAADAQLREANIGMLKSTRDALEDVSHAIAAKRSATAKKHA